MLQRGRGQGYLAALEAPREEVAADLVECLTHDPRWDSQVESRSLFYARLATRVSLDLSPVRAHLFSADDDKDRDEDLTGLALYTLGDLGRLGNSAAVSLLRRYVEVGSNWEWALDALAEVGSADAVRGLGPAVAASCATDKDLVQALMWLRSEQPVWNEWRLSTPRIDRAFASIEATQKSRTQGEVPESRSTEELLQLSQFNTWRILKDRTSQADVNLLMAATRDGSDGAKSAALIALGEQNNGAVLEPAELAVRTGSEQVARAGRMALFRLSSDSAVTKARGWLRESGHLGDAAAHILSEHGTAADIPALMEALERARAEQNLYAQSSLVEGLGRLRAERSASMIEVIFAETAYSYLRRRAAEALSAVSSEFPRGLAIECLWDCEEDTRALGATVASLGEPRVRERLAELSADNVEGDDARKVATERIQSQAG